VFTGDGKPVRKSAGYEHKKLKPPSGIGFAGCVSRATGRHSNVSLTHRIRRLSEQKHVKHTGTAESVNAARLYAHVEAEHQAQTLGRS
jgi:hypothetical protein